MRAPTSQQAGKPTVFINARLIDPASGRDEPGGILVVDGKSPISAAICGATLQKAPR